jgi:uncharacterized protein (DUF305 family)
MEQTTTNKNIIGLLIGALLLGGFGGYTIASSNQMDMDGMEMTTTTHTMPDGSVMDMSDMSGMGDMDMSEMSMAEMMTVMNDELGTKTGEEFEIAFLEGMIDHHVGAVDMAELVLKNTERPELVQLANEIIEAQEGEIELMREWQQAWFN